MTSADDLCDHTSVGILVLSDDRLLLIKRQKPPYGYAPPAGHIDAHGSAEQAAIAELNEEVGLQVTKLRQIATGIKANKCRRKNGHWHNWTIFHADVVGFVDYNPTEVASYIWAEKVLIQQLALRTILYLNKNISSDQWRDHPGLEIVWLEWLSQLGFFKL